MLFVVVVGDLLPPCRASLPVGIQFPIGKTLCRVIHDLLPPSRAGVPVDARFLIGKPRKVVQVAIAVEITQILRLHSKFHPDRVTKPPQPA